MFAQAASHYGYEPQTLLRMPTRLFWHMVRQIHRIEAQQDLRAIRVAKTAMAEDGGRDTIVQLQEEIGVVMRTDPEEERLDREGLAALKALGG